MSFSRNEIITVIVSISVGIIIRVIYDFVVKPILKKKEQTVSEKQLKRLIKNAMDSPEDFSLLLQILSHSGNELLRSYYPKLKSFDHKNLPESQKNDLNDLLKDLKKLTK
ncbi:MAG: hypothetical protein ACRC0X_00255 [Brevinema sp.]